MTFKDARDALIELLKLHEYKFIFDVDPSERIRIQFNEKKRFKDAETLLKRCAPIRAEHGFGLIYIELADVNRECIEELLGAARKYHPEPKVSCDEVRNIQDALCHANPREFDSRDLWVRLENGNYSNASDIEDTERLFWRVREAIAAGRPCAVVNATATVSK